MAEDLHRTSFTMAVALFARIRLPNFDLIM